MSELVKEEVLDTVVVQSDKKSITMGALVQAFFTFLSRVFGMVRDVMVSHIFGAGAITDAFFVAFTIPNVSRQFFAEGAFSMAFVPIYVSTREEEGLPTAREFFRDAFGFLLILLILLTFFGMVFSQNLVKMFAYGFSEDPSQLALATSMTRWMFPYILMISLVALFGAYLACYKRFAAMAASPILLNLSMIAAMFLWLDIFPMPAMALCGGVILGGVLQLALMIWNLIRFNLWATPTFSLKTDAMKKMLTLLGPGLFGVFVYQLNIIVLRQLASFLGDGQITYYYNADRLTQFATGVFAVSIATAALPELSRGRATFGNKAFFETLRFTLIITSFVITPCAFALLTFSMPLISMLFMHGAYTLDDTVMTAQTLMAFAPSLLAVSLSRPLIQAFYAQQDTKTPVYVGVMTVLLNLGIGLILLRFQIMGLSMTLSISGFMQFFMLSYLFKRKTPDFQMELFKPFLSHAGISVIACGLGLIVASFGDWEQGASIKNLVVLTALVGVSGCSYLALAYYFKLNEARKFIDGIKARLLKS